MIAVATLDETLPPRRDATAYLDTHELPFSAGPFDALGHRFAVRTNDRSVGEHLAAVFDAFRSATEPGIVYSVLDRGERFRHRYAFYAGDELMSCQADPSLALSVLFVHFNDAVIRGRQQTHLVLHAAAAERDGVVVVLPAPAESGKTTTVGGLLLAGFRYITDEAVVIDRDAVTIEPFPKALAVDPGSWQLLRELRPQPSRVENVQWQVPVQTTGRSVSTVRKPGVIVLPRYRAGATTCARPISAAEAVCELAATTFAFAMEAPANLRALARLAAAAPAYRLDIGDLDEAVGLIEQLVVEHRGHRPAGSSAPTKRSAPVP